jgi:streptogramin lyase
MVFAFAKIQAGTFVEWALPVGSPGPTANNGYLATSSEPLHLLPTFDDEGHVFFTQRNLGYLGMLAPNSGNITEWSLGGSALPHDITMVGNNVSVLDTSKQAPSFTTTVTPVTTSETPVSTTVTPTSRTLTPTVTKVQPTVAQKVNPVVAGGFAEWAIPTTDSGPGGIAAIDGILLFTERAGNKVGLLVP